MKKKLRIALISNLYPPYVLGGAEIMVGHLAEYLAGSGHEVFVISGAEKEEISVISGVQVMRVFPENLYWSYHNKPHSLWKKIIWHGIDCWNLFAARTVARLLSEVAPDIVHTHNIDGFSPIVWQVAKKQGLPLIHTAHDFYLMCPHTNLLKKNGNICRHCSWGCALYRRWRNRNAVNIDIFTAPSDFFLTMHKKAGITRARSYEIVPNGISDFRIRPLMPALYGGDKPLNLLYMGQLSPHKGIDSLLKLTGYMQDEKIVLHFAGKGPLSQKVSEYSRIYPNIVYHGFVTGSEKEELLSTADMLVLPSVCYENAPVSVLEAYQHGVPVIASRIGGLPELVEEGVSGLLFEPGDTADLFDKIRTVITRPALLTALRAGSLSMTQTYNIEQMANRYLQLYDRLL